MTTLRASEHIFGEREVGGTSVLYISDIPLDFLGLKADMGEEPLPDLTWAALAKVPPVAIGVGALMAGIYWVIGRRMKMQALARAEAQLEPEPLTEDLTSISEEKE